MQKRSIVIGGPLPLSRERVLRIVSLTNSFSAGVMLEGEGSTINGKSMLGLLTLTQAARHGYCLVTDGDDEAEALQAVARLFEET